MSEQDTLTNSEPTDGSGWYSNASATFGDRIAAAREARGYTQAELARKLGVKLKTVAGWEDDLSEPRANRISIMAGILSVSLMWLLNGEGEGVSDPSEVFEGAPDVTELLAEIRLIKGTITQAGEKLGGLEKRLRRALRNPSE